jgi:HAAS domain-containing protein
MTRPEMLQRKIDSYLAELRRCLGELPPEEVHDILQEIRGHILERCSARRGCCAGRSGSPGSAGRPAIPRPPDHSPGELVPQRNRLPMMEV